MRIYTCKVTNVIQSNLLSAHSDQRVHLCSSENAWLLPRSLGPSVRAWDYPTCTCRKQRHPELSLTKEDRDNQPFDYGARERLYYILHMVRYPYSHLSVFLFYCENLANDTPIQCLFGVLLARSGLGCWRSQLSSIIGLYATDINLNHSSRSSILSCQLVMPWLLAALWVNAFFWEYVDSSTIQTRRTWGYEGRSMLLKESQMTLCSLHCDLCNFSVDDEDVHIRLFFFLLGIYDRLTR